MSDILHGIAEIHRTEVVADRNPLAQLPELRPAELFPQFRLADEHDLDKLVLIRLEVGYEPNLLKHPWFEVLRLVDNQHHRPPLGVLFEEKAIERVQVPRAVRPVGRDAEFMVYVPQEVRGGLGWVEYQGGTVIVRVQLAQQGAEHRGLAGADLARQLDESGMTVNPEQKMRKRLFVVIAEEYESGIGCYGERFFPEPEIISIHADLPTKPFGGKRPGRGRTCLMQTAPTSPARTNQSIFLRITLIRDIIIYLFNMLWKHFFRTLKSLPAHAMVSDAGLR